MIIVRDLEKKYNNVTALKSVTFSINPATIAGIVGPNGAGKSTLLNILSGMIRETKGSVEIDCKDLTKNSLEIKKIMGVVPEIPALFDGLTGEEHLKFIGGIYGLSFNECKERSKELLKFLELDMAGERFLMSYSQGMKKKLAFISAIIHLPKVLLLDEPFDNVDPVSRKKMKEILFRMCNKGTTIIITSHSLMEVEDLCDEVVILYQGEIVYKDKTSEIRNKVRNTVTNETYESLEDIFLDLTGANSKEKNNELIWI